MRRKSVKQDKPAKSFDDLADVIRGGGSVRLDSGEVVTDVRDLRKALGGPASATEADDDGEGGEGGEQDILTTEPDKKPAATAAATKADSGAKGAK